MNIGERLMAGLARKAGIVAPGAFRSRGFSRSATTPAALEVFFNKRAMRPARWPNEGFVMLAGTPREHETRNLHGMASGALEHGFFYEDPRPGGWRELDEPGEWYLDESRGRLIFWPDQPRQTPSEKVFGCRVQRSEFSVQARLSP